MSPKRPFQSIRLRITLGTVLFTLLLSTAFGVASFMLFQNFAQASVLRAAEFSLQTVAQSVQQDLIELNSISNQQALNSSTLSALSQETSDRRKMVQVYDNASALVMRSRSYTYLQRLIITNCADRIVQVNAASSAAYYQPITQYNIERFPYIDATEDSIWQHIITDPFAPASSPASFLAVRPIYQPRTDICVGTVYVTASTRLLTNQLNSFGATPGAYIYFTTSAGSWRIEGESFVEETPQIFSVRSKNGIARSPDTVMETIRMADGGRYFRVSCPIEPFGITLSYIVPNSEIFAGQSALWAMILCLILLVLLVGAGLFVYLNRMIVQPVSKLRTRIQCIAQGDFSKDEEIEWNNELGDVGRGVNQLSTDVNSLMAKRVADEKERQHLEYKMLQNQVNPHFIYNTLNSIKWMATIQGASGIAEMTTAFSRLLKSVSKGNRPLHTLREEFALLNDYCTIQQYRYGGAITIEIADISDEALCNCLIPSFSLQPLAENAIFHGIEPKGGVGSIWLRIHQEENGDVCISMQDDGVGMEAATIEQVFCGEPRDETAHYSQIGLRNVHRRIQFAFGEEYGLAIESELGAYTRINLRIPYTHAKNPQKGEEQE